MSKIPRKIAGSSRAHVCLTYLLLSVSWSIISVYVRILHPLGFNEDAVTNNEDELTNASAGYQYTC